MTSTPASRSARATTLTPRSWPSSPALAIRMRIGLIIVATSREDPISDGLDKHRLPPGAVHGLHGFADLAYGCVRPHRLEYEWHCVLLTNSRIAQRLQAAIDMIVISLRLQLPKPLDLSALDL